MDESPVFRIPPVWGISEVHGQLSEMVDPGIEGANLPKRWADTKGKGASVCVLDTGVDLGHPELVVCDARDFTGGRNPIDRQRHGTHVAGRINAQHNDMLIRGGAPEADLFVGKVLDDFGNGTSKAIVAGIRWAIEIKADVLNMSFGSSFDDPAILEALADYTDQGGIPVAAAGNDGTAHCNSPARAEYVIAVGATDIYGRRAPFSSWGDAIDIACLGVDIVSTAPGGGLLKMSGTSMSAPLVSASCALLVAYHRIRGKDAKTPLRNVRDALEHLRASAQKFPDERTRQFGPGLIDVDAMLALDDPVPAPNVPPVGEGWVQIGRFRVRPVGDSIETTVG